MIPEIHLLSENVIWGNTFPRLYLKHPLLQGAEGLEELPVKWQCSNTTGIHGGAAKES